MNKVYLLLGTNLGEKENNIDKACEGIENEIGLIYDLSPIYETEPHGFKHESNFLNRVVCIRTCFSADEVLEKILAIELKMGRTRTGGDYQARVIDIDILFFGDQIIEKPGLIVPHPRLQDRKFVLIPLNEIASDLIHPTLKKSVSELLEKCYDEGMVKKYQSTKE
ncbi:MAG: 2-amino-4-hydroxy-6-hydroxymethyldihydropteridine diphosphokinase [Bacteroidetes bacterium GWF2_38_335]|nr:MAG: 2-amino-4-hydroxy-6-hydroxymethyldihydropteridine diphosphokinase [Bacteroidetes bacterium GWF2_38_335]OFY80342.1 MAG: 2-amino-4-hydroxy-6-hydroxymethyldihydropteridine diphosphokinase [Bacteroidetes bacterium RIFOXYA12_FULL_38_20]HBS88857.1 2-amino-4-hydroxy-6-hydroxymethyldihydropteridine diphosphokinase [Bacteroidales bacterium]